VLDARFKKIKNGLNALKIKSNNGMSVKYVSAGTLLSLCSFINDGATLTDKKKGIQLMPARIKNYTEYKTILGSQNVGWVYELDILTVTDNPDRDLITYPPQGEYIYTRNTIYALNIYELNNDTADVAGNGIDLVTLLTNNPTFQLMPCPIDTNVLVYAKLVDESAGTIPECLSVAYRFFYSNSIIGGCDTTRVWDYNK
jgi:hypothetical protein